MKKNYLFLMFLFLTSVVFGQTTVTIGTGGSTSGTNDWGNPIYRSAPTSSFNFSQSVHLYNSTQLNGVGITSGATVTAMGFHKTTASTLSAGRTATLNIYMKNSTATALVNNQSMAVWTTGATLVYSNPAVTPADLVNIGANSFTFTAPFNYTGQNVEVAWDWEINAGTGNPTDGSFLWSYDAATAQAVGRASGSAITLDLTTVQPRTYKADFTFTAGAACTGTPAPGNTISSDPSICATLPFTLSLQNFTGGAGVSYQWESADDAAFTLGVASLGTSITQSTSQTSDKYYRCTVTCAGNTGVSTPVLVTMNAPTSCYCDPTYANGGGGDNIANVTLGILSNSTTGNVAPYYTFYNTLAIPDIGQSTNADVSITMGTDGNQWAAVWIDFNQDGIFDASEGVVSTANAGGGGTVIISVPVPAGATLGNTRMRVRGGNDSQLTTAQACGASSSPWGESEDYLVNITLPPACLATNGLISTVSSATSAQLDWDITATGSGYNWEVRTSGAPGSGAAGLVASGNTPTSLDTFVVVSSLSSQTTYSAYVQTDCGTGTSVWSSPSNFTTPCSALTAPYLETFTGTTQPPCFTQSATTGGPWVFSGNPGWSAAGTVDHTTGVGVGNYTWMDFSGTDVGVILNFPLIDVSTLTVPELKFFLFSHDDGTITAADYNTLFIEAYDGTAWQLVGTHNGDLGNDWAELTFNLTGFAGPGNILQMRFRAESSGTSVTYENDFLVDDVEVREQPLCPNPVSLSVTLGAASTVDLAWTENGSATSWNIIYGLTGFDPLTAGTTVPAGTNPINIAVPCGGVYDFYVASDCGINGISPLSGVSSVDMGPCPCTGAPAPGNTISSATDACVGVAFDLSLQNNPVVTGYTYVWESADDINFTTNLQTLTSTTETQNVASQTAASYYRCIVTCTASALSTTSTPVLVAQNAPTDCYCVPVTTQGCSDGDVIAQVKLNTLDNNSGTGCPSGIVGYSDYTDSLQANYTTTLTAGNSYNCIVWAGQWGEGYAAWIDYNDDGFFDNVTERIGFTPGQVAGSGSVGVLGDSAVFPITLACNPPLGTHRLRVRAMYFVNGGAVTPCTANTFGETEDYEITIVAAAACPAPSGLSIISTTTTSVELGWAIGCTETAWNVIYGPVGFDPLTAGTTVSASNDTTTITGLTCGTPYDFYVLADCGGAGPSIPSFVASGSTAGCPSLAITAMIEGYYLPGTGLMKSVIANSQFLPPTLECDTLTVELHDPLSTLSVPLVAQSFTGVLATDGTMDMTWPLTIAGNSYYIVLKHRNALETWSVSPVTINAGTTYDFTVQANVFGNNVKLVNPGVYALFSGNLNGDGFIDVGDYPVWETSSNAFAFGYVSADINGDGLVDLSDYTIWEGNSNAFVFVFAPF